jgi:hypothetical protein
MFGSAEMSFVGSLPVHTNFWDLCVRPEFQDLFRTTSNRLVTESHKDFCANTAFRWDIYSKQPQVIVNTEARVDLIDGLYFRSIHDDVKLPHQVNLGVITSTVQGPLYESLLSILSQKTLSLPQILSHHRLSGNAPADVIRAIDAGVAMGLFDVSANSFPSTKGTAQSQFFVSSPSNQSVLKNDLLSGRPISLASVATGTGHSLGDFDAAILHELNEAGKAGLADRVIARLADSKRSLQRDGKPVADKATHQEMVEQACARFIKTSLPQLSRLGIVEEEST